MAVITLAAAVTAALIEAPVPVTVALATAAAGFQVWALLVRTPSNIDQTPDPASWIELPHIRALLEAIDTPTLIVSPAGYLILANQAAQSLLSPARPLPGRALEEVFTKAEILDLVASARRGVAKASHVRIPTSEGARVLDVVTSPLPAELTPDDPPGALAEATASEADSPELPADTLRRGVVIAVRDITDLSLAMQLKTDFVANASHELRTPISAIRAAVDTLGVAGQDDAMRARLLDMIGRHTTRLDELVRDMLDLAKLESPDAPLRIREFSATDIAQELAEGLDRACSSRGITLRFELPEAFERLRTDRRILMLILKNLTENAIKFTGEGTQIVIRGTVLDPDGPEMSRGARFEVIDKGAGIPASQQPRIFERFYQVDEARTGEPQARGTGLGLAIVKHGVNSLGGSVTVYSVWQKGTTMTVDLPSALPSQDAAAGQLDTV